MIAIIPAQRNGCNNVPLRLSSQKTWYGDVSCELKVEGFNKDKVIYPERANNSLHIWELANMFQQLGQTEGLLLLVPKEIEQALTAGLQQGEIAAVTSEIEQANVIATLNGPMAHVYVKGATGWSEQNGDAVMLGKVADKLSLYFAENGVGLRQSKTCFPGCLHLLTRF